MTELRTFYCPITDPGAIVLEDGIDCPQIKAWRRSGVPLDDITIAGNDENVRKAYVIKYRRFQESQEEAIDRCLRQRIFPGRESQAPSRIRLAYEMLCVLERKKNLQPRESAEYYSNLLALHVTVSPRTHVVRDAQHIAELGLSAQTQCWKEPAYLVPRHVPLECIRTIYTNKIEELKRVERELPRTLSIKLRSMLPQA